MATVAYGSVPFQEQIAFFRKKLNLPTSAWTDVYTREHDWAFVVAGADRDEIVSAFRGAIDKAIAGGATLEEFRKDFDAIVEQYGWDYQGGRNWRSRVIYETNLRTSYAAGRYEQLQQLKRLRPFWRYCHSDAVVHPRPLHLKWNNTVLPADDPWWSTHFGPNGWGCQCYVEGLNARDVKRLGLAVGPRPEDGTETVVIGQRSPNGPRTVTVPKGIDPGFEYTPGKARLESQIPPEIPDPPVSGSAGGAGLPNRRPSDPLPAPRRAPASRLLPANLSDERYTQAFLQEFGATPEMPAIFRDVLGEPLPIGNRLFLDPSGVTKINKRGRGQYLLLLADAIKSPDEIWVRLEWHGARTLAVVRRRYIARFQVQGSDKPLLAVFERGEDGWFSVTGFAGDTQQADDWRVGVRLYRRQE